MSGGRPRVLLDTAVCVYGPFALAATDAGICRVTVPGEPPERLHQWLARLLPAAGVVAAPGALSDVAGRISAYLEGGPDPLPGTRLDLYGTPFQVAVWQAVAAIPYGETRSYAEVARSIGRPGAARAVGAANAANPLPFLVPCQRVIGADGTIKGFPGGLITRAALLALERPAGSERRSLY